MASTVQKQLPVAVDISFVENHHKRWRLDELLRKRRNARDAGREAMPFRIVLAQVGATLLVEFFGPGLKRNLAQGRETESGIPDAGKVDFSFRRTWSRTNGRFFIAE